MASTFAAGSKIRASALNQRGVIGGTEYSGTGNFAAGIGTTEVALNMSTGAVVLAANTRYHIHVKYKVTWGSTTQAGVFHIRDTNLSGSVRGEDVRDAANTGSGHTYEFFGKYETTAVETKTWVLTGNTTASSMTVVGGGTANLMWMLVEDMGPTGLVTASTSP